MKKSNGLLQGFIDTIPLGVSVAIYGLVYGVLGGKAGLSVFEVAGLSLFVFAGASQIAAVQMIALGTSPATVIATIFIINLRHYLFGASLSQYIGKASAGLKMLASFFMTDESYAVTYSHFQKEKPNILYFLGSGLNIYVFWGAAGVLGYFLGNSLPAEISYILDFAFVAAFIGMLAPMIKKYSLAVTVIVSGAISLLLPMVLPGKWYILIAGIVASLVGYLSSRIKKQAAAGSCIMDNGGEAAVED